MGKKKSSSSSSSSANRPDQRPLSALPGVALTPMISATTLPAKFPDCALLESAPSSSPRDGPMKSPTASAQANPVGEDASSPDPRWPYLHRWSAKKLAVASSPSVCDPSAGTVPPVSDPPLPATQDVASHPVEVAPTQDVAPSTLQDASGPLPAVHEAAESGEIHGSTTGPPLKGAWVKKLTHPSAHPQQGIPGEGSRWPSLSEARAICTKQGTATRTFEPRPVEDNQRFPWAAKMNPASRNLYRASEPEYMEDGTPKVTIPPEVMLQGIENQKDYILGQFFRCLSPPGGLIYAVFNKLWGRNCRITIRKLSDSTYLFHVPDESTRKWIIQRGLWHVDDCLMFVAPWTPEASLEIPEIKTIPVWVTLKKIPHILYSIPGISHIASGLGAPMATHKPRLDPIHMGEAKILVEVELSKAFPTRIAAGDSSGFISMVDVYYAWLPGTCSRCGQLGHKPKRCLLAEDKPTKTDPSNDSPHLGQSEKPLAGTKKSKDQGTPQVQTTDLMSSDRIATGSTRHVGTPAAGTIASSSMAPGRDSDNAGQNESPPKTGPLGLRRAMSSGALDNNRFSTLESSAEEDSSDVEETTEENVSSDDEDASDTNDEPEPTDFLSPSGKRILRERPVVPTTKAREMQWHPVGGGRGNRGRGNGRGRGRG